MEEVSKFANYLLYNESSDKLRFISLSLLLIGTLENAVELLSDPAPMVINVYFILILRK